MMDVQRMRLVVDDVERGALPPVALRAAERWSERRDPSGLVYVRSSANHLFRFDLNGHLCYLRLAHADERRATRIAAELDFVRHVGDEGLAVARPVVSINGLLVEEVTCEGQRYLAVVFEGLHGAALDPDELDEGRLRAWGRALALVHRASQSFAPHPALPHWTDEARAALKSLPPEETDVARVLTAGLAWLETLALPEQDYGVIHGDFELDNLIWDGPRVQALDFDDAAYAWYAIDIAVALQDVWPVREPDETALALRSRRFAWFASGYTAVRPLPTGLPESMPRLLTLLLAVKMARLLRAYATTPTDGDSPAWVAQMRARHQRWLADNRSELRGE